MTNTTKTEFAIVALNPSTGIQLRDATIEESISFMAQPTAYRNALRIGSVLIQEWTGYGVNFDQGTAS